MPYDATTGTLGRRLERLDDRESLWLVKSRPYRFIAFLVLAVVFTAYLAAGQYWHALDVCEDAVARVGTSPSVRLCSAPSITALWPLLLVVVAPLLPDIGTISLGGLLEVTRLAKRADERAAAAEQQSLRIGTVVVERGLPETTAALPAKEQQFRSELETAAEPGDREPPAEEPPEERAQLVARLEWLWSRRLAPALALADRVRSEPSLARALADRDSRLDERTRALLAELGISLPWDPSMLLRYETVFADELGLTAVARESAGALNATRLREAVEVAERLDALLENALR